MPRSQALALLTIALLAFGLACARETAETPEPAEAMTESTPPEPETLEPPEKPTENVGAAVTGMDAVLETAAAQAGTFASDELPPAEKRQAVVDALAKIAVEGDTVPEWLSQSRAAAKELAQATEIEPARAAYGRLSDALVAYADTHETTVSDLAKIHCPMAPEGIEGTWLQKGTEVRNPWYGAKMLHCGTIEWATTAAAEDGEMGTSDKAGDAPVEG